MWNAGYETSNEIIRINKIQSTLSYLKLWVMLSSLYCETERGFKIA